MRPLPVATVASLDGGLRISWREVGSETANSYMAVAIGNGQNESCVPIPPEIFSCVIDGLTNGRDYIVQVRGVYAGGETATSLAVTGTPNLPTIPNTTAARRWLADFATNTAFAATNFIRRTTLTPTQVGQSTPAKGAWQIFGDISHQSLRVNAPGDDGYSGSANSVLVGASRSTTAAQFGVALVHAEGRGEAGATRNATNARQTGALIFAGKRFDSRVNTWALLGAGIGKLDETTDLLTQSDYDIWHAGVGAEALLDDSDDTDARLGIDVMYAAIDSENRAQVDLNSNDWRAKTYLALDKTFQIKQQRTLTTSGELALRYDNGDLREGLGLEIGAGLNYANLASGISARLHGQWLAVHAEDQTGNWNVSASAGYDARASGGKWQLVLKSHAGESNDSTVSDSHAFSGIDMDLIGAGYALAKATRLEPFVGTSAQAHRQYAVRTGVRLTQPSDQIFLEFSLRRITKPQSDASNEVWLLLEHRY